MSYVTTWALVACAVLAFVAPSTAQLITPWRNEQFTVESNIGCGSPEAPYVSPVLLPAVHDTPGIINDASVQLIDVDVADVARFSDFALDSQDLRRAHCVLELLHFWASADAYVCNDTVVESSGTKFTTSVASAYLKIMHTLPSTSSQRTTVETWFATLQGCNKNWTMEPLEGWNGINDPHFSAYAGLLSVLETSLVLQDVSTFEWAAQKLDAALDSVTAAGLMANTTSNRKMLLVQSAGVLTFAVPAAILVHENMWNGTIGINVTTDPAAHPGLARMAWRTAHGINDPAFFTQQIGSVQISVDCAEGDTWPWLYRSLLVASSDASAIVTVSKQAAANLSLTYSPDVLSGLVTRCDPEDTFDTHLGGRTCWWDPSTFYSSPCVGWTNGPIIAFVITATTVCALFIFCVCFLCNKDTFMDCIVNKKQKAQNPEEGQQLRTTTETPVTKIM